MEPCIFKISWHSLTDAGFLRPIVPTSAVFFFRNLRIYQPRMKEFQHLIMAFSIIRLLDVLAHCDQSQ